MKGYTMLIIALLVLAIIFRIVLHVATTPVVKRQLAERKAAREALYENRIQPTI